MNSFDEVVIGWQALSALSSTAAAPRRRQWGERGAQRSVHPKFGFCGRDFEHELSVKARAAGRGDRCGCCITVPGSGALIYAWQKRHVHVHPGRKFRCMRHPA